MLVSKTSMSDNQCKTYFPMDKTDTRKTCEQISQRILFKVHVYLEIIFFVNIGKHYIENGRKTSLVSSSRGTGLGSSKSYDKH